MLVYLLFPVLASKICSFFTQRPWPVLGNTCLPKGTCRLLPRKDGSGESESLWAEGVGNTCVHFSELSSFCLGQLSVLKHALLVFPQRGLELGASEPGKSEVARSKVHRKSPRPACFCASDFCPLGYASKRWPHVESHSTFFDNQSSQNTLNNMPDASHAPRPARLTSSRHFRRPSGEQLGS